MCAVVPTVFQEVQDEVIGIELLKVSKVVMGLVLWYINNTIHDDVSLCVLATKKGGLDTCKVWVISPISFEIVLFQTLLMGLSWSIC